MIFFSTSGGAIAIEASTTMTARNAISWFLYGDAKRAIRFAVPGASLRCVTAGSRENDRIACMGPPGPIGPDTTPPSRESL